MVLPSAPGPVAALPRGLVACLEEAGLRLDGVERPRPGHRADEPAHRTMPRARDRVVVRPGWGGRDGPFPGGGGSPR